MRSLIISSVFTLVIAGISLVQGLLFGDMDRFILSTARLVQVPSGAGQKSKTGPGALLDGNASEGGRTSIMAYPLGPPDRNYFWMELGISHFPAAADEKGPGRTMPDSPPASTDSGSDAIDYQIRVPRTLRIWNGRCSSFGTYRSWPSLSSESSSSQKSSHSAGTPQKLKEGHGSQNRWKLKRARLDFYYRPLNDPDQDFGYPTPRHVAEYEISIPADSDNFDLSLDLPDFQESHRYPENMEMILLKLTVLEVQPEFPPESDSMPAALDTPDAPASSSPSSSPIHTSTANEEDAEQRLAICEIQYGDAGHGQGEDFFVFW